MAVYLYCSIPTSTIPRIANDLLSKWEAKYRAPPERRAHRREKRVSDDGSPMVEGEGQEAPEGTRSRVLP